MPPKSSKTTEKTPRTTPKTTPLKEKKPKVIKDIDTNIVSSKKTEKNPLKETNEIIPIILESPNKIKKILSILSNIKDGKKYIVLASCGHFRSLSNNNPSNPSNPSFNGMGFCIDYDLDNKINIEYIEDTNKKSVISNLKSKCSSAKTIYLATDPDREGEAIAWHISELLAKRGRKFFRIKFNSITKSEVLKALENPIPIDMDLVFAQQTRQIIDKWIGFKVSPLCWQSVFYNKEKAKSAGRVQSPALKLLVDREREVINFKSREYFTINGHFSLSYSLDNTSNKTAFSKVEKQKTLEIKEVPLRTYYDYKKPIQFDTEEEAMKIIDALASREGSSTLPRVRDNIFEITKKNKWKFSIEEKETQIHPPPPYTTLTILQDCNTFLKIKPEQTMFLLQKMYESGWITYHRTDSVVLSTEGLFQTRQALQEYLPLGPELITEKPRNYTNKSLNAQEAHEPIRPTHFLKGCEPERRSGEAFEISDLESYLSSDCDISKGEKSSGSTEKDKMDPKGNVVKHDTDTRIFKIYSMIYLRTLATQCIPQTNTVYTLTFSLNDNNIQFSISYSYLKHLGYKTLYLEDKKKPNKFCLKTIGNSEKIPEWLLEISQIKQDITNINLYEFAGQQASSALAELEQLELESHHTKPPPYFTESSIIKELESYGIGRPSTYASILSKLFDNNYVIEDKTRILHPTNLGIQLVDFLETRYKTHFMNLEYTQNMEKILDEIAEGKTKWTSNVIKFIKEFP